MLLQATSIVYPMVHRVMVWIISNVNLGVEWGMEVVLAPADVVVVVAVLVVNAGKPLIL